MNTRFKNTTAAFTLTLISFHPVHAGESEPDANGVLPRFDSVEDQLEEAMRTVNEDSLDDAVPLFEPLAEAGCAQAQYMLSTKYSWDENHERLIEFTESASEQGHTGAMWLRGYAYESRDFPDVGYGTRDYDEAAKWYRRAAENGYQPAMTRLNFLYSWNVLDEGPDLVEQYKWLALAAPRTPDEPENWGLTIGSRSQHEQELAEIANNISAEELERAQQWVQEWEAEHNEIRHVPETIDDDVRHWLLAVEGGCDR